MKRVFALLLVVFILFIPISACGRQERIPSPTEEFYVNDLAGVLDKQTKEYILEQSIRLNDLSDAQVVVVTIDSTGDIPLEEYSLDILREWGIGHRDKNNGVLILIAVEDRKSRIEVGYGLEGALPDSKTGWIQDDYMLPYFSAGDYSTGILEGYKAILLEIYNEYNLDTDGLGQLRPHIPDSFAQTPETESTDDGMFLVLFLIGFLLFDSFFLRGRILRLLFYMLFGGRRGGPRGGNWGGGSRGGGGWSGGSSSGGGSRGGGGSGGGGGSSRSW